MDENHELCYFFPYVHQRIVKVFQGALNYTYIHSPIADFHIYAIKTKFYKICIIVNTYILVVSEYIQVPYME